MTPTDPITLKTLPQATAQQVFDQVAIHLITQGERSMSNDPLQGCAYLGDNGMKCAAGCLIAPDEYSPDMEDVPWGDLVDAEKVPSVHMGLIRDLQYIHDQRSPDMWADALHILAAKQGLNVDCLTKSVA